MFICKSTVAGTGSVRSKQLQELSENTMLRPTQMPKYSAIVYVYLISNIVVYIIYYLINE